MKTSSSSFALGVIVMAGLALLVIANTIPADGRDRNALEQELTVLRHTESARAEKARRRLPNIPEVLQGVTYDITGTGSSGQKDFVEQLLMDYGAQLRDEKSFPDIQVEVSNGLVQIHHGVVTKTVKLQDRYTEAELQKLIIIIGQWRLAREYRVLDADHQ